MAKKYNTDEYKQVTTPANPTGGFNKLYFKADNKAYRLDSTGVETEIGGSSSGGSPFATDIIVNGQTVGKGGGNLTSNTVHGIDALVSNTSGIRNHAIGQSALYSNTTGANNIANGVESLQFNTTGSGNNAMGYQSLNQNTTGDANVAIGSYALSQNTTGYYNVASGVQALNQNTIGINNTAFGTFALVNANSSNNTAFGKSAGASVSGGDSNTFIGKEADTSLSSASNSTAIGNGATVTASNQVVIGNASVTDTVLRGAVTATSFNGVELTTGGGTTNFLRADGTYAAPGGGTSSLDCVGLRVTAGGVVLTTTPTALTFDTETLDTAGYHDNVTDNSRITIPSGKDGNYAIDFLGSVSASTSSDFTASIQLYKNGSPVTNILSIVTPYPAGGGGGGNAQIGLTTALALVAGDYLEIYASKSGSVMAFNNGTTFRAIKL